ncbi:cobyrinate a,c-diamide synthase [Marinimicrococcus flavescens]|uniref:Cobyrinate a,c-diamide synthase n=1 Tax=Marinimicrococcus flavescens TaxID=3031815 RepID=A0AAP3XSU6_9PROT|nr:cobyrinate a,c-diamide synthase [Marinimicrococcus flavescens]
MAAPALLVAAPAGGAGKTLLTVGLARALRRRGLAVACFKVGPDRSGSALLARACGRPCPTLDSWAMRLETLVALLDELGHGPDIVLGDGAGGLFDGAPGGAGSTADLASLFDLPVLLVVDCRGLGASIAALVEGYGRFREDAQVAMLAFNRVAGADHARCLVEACEERFSTPVLGWLREESGLGPVAWPDATAEATELLIERAAALVASHLDIERLLRLARPPSISGLGAPACPLPPLGARIAVARDAAFTLACDSVLGSWRRQGAGLSFFSPLADEPPEAAADAVYLPSGHLEENAGRLAAASRWRAGMAAAAARGAFVYGEGAGYAALGQSLALMNGESHPMAGLLPIATSLRKPRREGGYRAATMLDSSPLGPPGTVLRAWEAAHAAVTRGACRPLLVARDGRGRLLGETGCREGSIAGSFLQLVDLYSSAVTQAGPAPGP